MLQDSCVADEPKVICIIRDLVDPQANAIKHTMNLPGSMSVRVLLAEVCKQFGYMLNTISLHYEKQEGTENLEVGIITGEYLKEDQFVYCFNSLKG